MGKRVKNQREAAQFLDITPTRLRQMPLDSPWWKPELRTDEGYDVCGIVRAQVSFHANAAGDDEVKKRLEAAELASAEAKAQADQLKAWNLEKEKQLAEGKILPADLYIEFCRELLGMIRSALEELPESIAEHCPPDVKRWIYVPESEWKSERDASEVQKGIRKLIADIEKWLNEDAEGEAE